MKIREKLTYLLIVLLPIQLGRHFFQESSKIAGIYSDYLIPTIYVTDILVFIIIAFDITGTRKERDKGIIYFLCYLVFSAIFIAENKWAAMFRAAKIIEFVWLFTVVSKSTLNKHILAGAYSVAVAYSSLLALLQFVNQKSIGGFWWYFGERSFSWSTPGIALGTFANSLFLRPYSTFPHPNVFAGFLALGLPFIFYRAGKKRNETYVRNFYYGAFCIGAITLFFTYSRAAWAAFLIGMAIAAFRKTRINLFPVFTLLLILSICVPLFLARPNTVKRGSLFERKILIEGTLAAISDNPVFGAGAGNAISSQYEKLPKYLGLFTQQPVHNIYLHFVSEFGLTGLIFLLAGIHKLLQKSKMSDPIVFAAFVQVLFLGFFDHYLFTLQQGMLLTVMFSSLVMRPEK